MLTNCVDVLKEQIRAFHATDSVGSFLKLSIDLLSVRRLRYFPKCWYNQPRSVRLRDGTVLHYRRNQGDLWSLREIWLFECYRLPFDRAEGKPLKTLVDLGANIGMTSVWLHKRYGYPRIIAVEADASNCEIARRNFEANNVPVELISAAIGPYDGEARFAKSELSNVGRVSPEGGTAVQMISMRTVLARLQSAPSTDSPQIDLLKIDIEGGEEALLQGDVGWLDQVSAIVIELHPGLVDCEAIAKFITERGMRFLPTNSVFPGSMGAFVR